MKAIDLRSSYTTLALTDRATIPQNTQSIRGSSNVSF